MEHSSLKLEVNPPFRLDLTVWVLRRRSQNIIDRWVDRSWRRVIVIENKPIEIIVSQNPSQGNALLNVKLFGLSSMPKYKKAIAAFLERCLGIKRDLTNFYKMAEQDKTLNPLATRFLGLKPPRFPTVFEGAVNGIACQQVSLDLGIILLNRLSTAYGPSIQSMDSVSYAFPRPEDLAKLSPDDFRKLGYSRQKGRAIIELSQGIVSGGLDLEKFERLNNSEALTRLCELRGIGRWTGEYVLLRGLGRLDVFPADDVGGRRGIQQWLDLSKAIDYTETKNLVAKWNPYSGFVYFHLLMNRLVQEGVLQA